MSAPSVQLVTAKHGEQIRAMFSAIAPTYDRLNHLLSLNRDRVWRRTAIRLLSPDPGDYVLDLCGGTGDLAIECLSQQPRLRGPVVADFSLPMLRIAKTKLSTAARPQAADALRLPYKDGAFDSAMIAFGVRNFADVRMGLQEIRRVIRPGGKALILEFFRPTGLPLRLMSRMFFRRIMPLVGRAISGHDFAYSYLPQSMESFYTCEEFAALLTETGFGEIAWRNLDGGIASMFLATRQTGECA